MLSPHDRRRVAVESCSSERTVRAYLRDPTRVRSTSAARIETALRQLGFRPIPDVAAERVVIAESNAGPQGTKQ